MSSSSSSSSSPAVPDRFVGLSLYTILSLPTTPPPSSSDISKSYRRSALKYHPDHNQSTQAHEEFTYLTLAYQILSNEAARKLYDRTGEMNLNGISLKGEDGEEIDAYEYWRSRFPPITKEDVDKYEETYLDSAEELEDLKNAYERFFTTSSSSSSSSKSKSKSKPKTPASILKNAENLFECVPFASSSSIPRLCQRLFTELNVSPSDFVTVDTLVSKIKKKEEKEEKESEKMRKENGTNGEGGIDDLRALILAKKSSTMANMIMGLEAKYGGKNGEEEDEDQEEEEEEEDEEEEKQAKGKKSKAKPKAKSSSNKGGQKSTSSDLVVVAEPKPKKAKHAQAELSDADFEALQAKMLARGKTKATGGSKKGKK